MRDFNTLNHTRGSAYSYNLLYFDYRNDPDQI